MTYHPRNTKDEERLIDEGGANSLGSRQVKVLANGAVQIMYKSFDEYLRDLELHRSGEGPRM